MTPIPLVSTPATNLGLTFALPQFKAQHNYEDLKPTDNPFTVPTSTKADNGHMLNPLCGHNPLTSQVDPHKCLNSLVSPYPHSGEHLLKESAEDIRVKYHPVNWLKFISSMSSKTSILSLHLLDLSLSTWHIHHFLEHQWTINLHDGYPLPAL